MSVRDTGWEREGESAWWRRSVGAAGLIAVDGGGWWLDTPSADGPSIVASGRLEDLDRNKRAAEEALRKLCRDTLAALGDAP